MNLLRCSLIVLIITSMKAESYKYFISTPALIKSLNGLISAVAHALADAGHEVTFLTPYPLSKKHPNITLVLYPTQEKFYGETNIFEKSTIAQAMKWSAVMALKNAESFWNSPLTEQILEKVNEHDAFITTSYLNEFTFPLLDTFEGPFVQICTPGVEFVALTREGNWLPPSVIPSMALNYDDHMTFWERALNLPMAVNMYFKMYAFINQPLEVVRRYQPQIDDLTRYYDRVALTLINGHFALDGPVPLLPSQIEIGTINAKKPQPLPKDLEDFVNGSGDAGLIYFSLGSIAKSTDIPQKAKDMFVEAFRRVPQRILWKYEGTDLQLPPNVKTQAWMPQQDILGHPKTRVFISHCGNLGTQESKYHGVPTLAVPIAFDQPRNAARMERKGYAIVLYWDDMTTDKIVEALDKLINDTSYKERLETVSRVLQDQKDTPAERAVWWLEYVVRHKGAPHLHYAGRRLSLFQYIMLDVILFWAAIFFTFLFLFVYIIKYICCRRTKEKLDSKQKKKKN